MRLDCSKYDPNRNKARVCNTAPESKRNLFQIDPLPWTLNFPSGLSGGPRCEAPHAGPAMP